MRRLILSLILLVFVFPLSRSATAQTDAKCDPASVIAAANKLKAAGDNKADMRALYSIAQQITDMDIACNGMVFKGKGDRVLDPITMPKGFYKVTVAASGFFIMDYTIISGDCEADAFPNIFNASPSDFMTTKVETHEATLTVPDDGCRYVFKSSNTQGKDWTLTFDIIE